MPQQELQTVADIYAEAVYQLALDQDKVAVLREQLTGLAQICREQVDFQTFLEIPTLSSDVKFATLQKWLDAQIDELLMDFLGVLAGRERLGLLPTIARRFAALDDKGHGLTHAQVVTAVALTDIQRQELEEQLGQITGGKILLTCLVDPGIIGGMVLTIDDQVYDNSVSNQLQRFGTAFRGQLGPGKQSLSQFLETKTP